MKNLTLNIPPDFNLTDEQNQAVEIINFSNTQNPPTLSGESILPGLMIDLEPIFRRY